MYDIAYTDTALKQLSKLPSDIEGRILNTVLRARSNPFHYFFKMTGRDFYRMRVGDYRILADIQQEKLLILVIKVGNRKNVYD